MAISETPTARQLAEATAQKLWQWVDRGDAEGRDVTGPLDPADLIEAAILDGRKALEAQLERVQQSEHDGWTLLNQVAEALGLSNDGGNEWDRTELLETARVCNADDYQERKARLASVTAEFQAEREKHDEEAYNDIQAAKEQAKAKLAQVAMVLRAMRQEPTLPQDEAWANVLESVLKGEVL